MYSIQKAAEILDKSEATVRRWVKRFGIKLVEVETDRKRIYIADDDMNILLDHITQKIKRGCITLGYLPHYRKKVD
jgi:transposase